MGQMGFFDLSRRYEGLDRKNDALVSLEELVPWETFRRNCSPWLGEWLRG